MQEWCVPPQAQLGTYIRRLIVHVAGCAQLGVHTEHD